MKPLFRKLTDYIILHIGINDPLDNTSREIFDKALKLKSYIPFNASAALKVQIS